MVVLSPQFELTVGKYKVGAIKTATVEMTRKKPSDICKLEFPNHRDFTLSVFDEADVVALSLGFKEFAIAPVFAGTVTDIEPNLPLRLICKTPSQAATARPYKALYESATWAAIAEDALARGGMVPQVSQQKPFTLPPAKYRVDNQTPAEVLNNVADATGFVWYAIPGTENGYFGPPQEVYQPKKPYVFTVGTNVYSKNCKLEYVKTHRLKKITVVLPDSERKLPTALGVFKATDYQDGDREITLHKAPVVGPTAAIAEQVAAQEYSTLSPSGFVGSFRAVGNPYIRQGSEIALIVPNYDDNTRHAIVERVIHRFGNGVYEMDVTLAGGTD